MFRAPVRDAGGKLTEAELLSRPAPATATAPRKPDVMLLLPAFGLLLCGIAGMLINAVLLYLLLSDPVWGKEWSKAQLEAVRARLKVAGKLNALRAAPAAPAPEASENVTPLQRSARP